MTIQQMQEIEEQKRSQYQDRVFLSCIACHKTMRRITFRRHKVDKRCNIGGRYFV